MLATLGVAGVVCCAACTSGDICQDLKIGQIVGATARRLQIGELIGTMIPAFIIAPVMSLLDAAYGIGAPAREGIPALKAPQAVMFEKLVGGIFGQGKDIPWDLVGYGAAIGIAAIVIDRHTRIATNAISSDDAHPRLRNFNFRLIRSFILQTFRLGSDCHP